MNNFDIFKINPPYDKIFTKKISPFRLQWSKYQLWFEYILSRDKNNSFFFFYLWFHLNFSHRIFICGNIGISQELEVRKSDDLTMKTVSRVLMYCDNIRNSWWIRFEWFIYYLSLRYNFNSLHLKWHEMNNYKINSCVFFYLILTNSH